MTPETFEREMQVRLGPHYRLRWSDERHVWCIEHKVGRKIDFPGDSDRAIRLRDGYHLVLETLPSNLFICPECHFPTPLEPFEKQEVVCDYCKLHGSKRRHIAAYFPLVDRTLTWLEQWHPRRGAAIDQELQAHNATLARDRARARGNVAEDAALDGWSRLIGSVQFGYTKRGTPHQFGAD